MIFVRDDAPTCTFPLSIESHCVAVDRLKALFAVVTQGELSVYGFSSEKVDKLSMLWNFGLDVRVLAACFGRNWLACATDETIQVFESTSGILLSALSLTSPSKVIRLFAPTPIMDGDLCLISITESATVTVWKTKSWSRCGAIEGPASFSRVIAGDCRMCSDKCALVAVALADGRVATILHDTGNHDPCIEPRDVLKFNTVVAVRTLACEAVGVDCTLEGECAIGVEILHEDRLVFDTRVHRSEHRSIAMLSISTQRRVIIAELSQSGILRGLVCADFEELVGHPLLARECCLYPAAADPISYQGSPASLAVEAVLVIGAVFGGRPVCVNIEHLLQGATKLAHNTCDELDVDTGFVTEHFDDAGQPNSTSDVVYNARFTCLPDEGVLPGSSTASSSVSGFGTVSPSLENRGCEEGIEVLEHADDAISECVVGQVPDVLSFLVQVRCLLSLT